MARRIKSRRGKRTRARRSRSTRRSSRKMRGGNWTTGVIGAHSGYSVAGVHLPSYLSALANPAPFINQSRNI
jgi:hypothetical protein